MPAPWAVRGRLARPVVAAPAFVPTDIAGLIGWWKADAGVYKDAGSTLAANTETVQQWNDQSGGTNHFSQATAGARPTYQTGVLNGLPVVHLDATDDGMLSTTALVVPLTVFLVGRSHATGSQADRLVQGATGTNWLITPRYGSSLAYYAGGFISSSALANVTDQWYLLIGRQESPSANSSLSVDGTDRTQSTTPNASPNALALGFSGLNAVKADGDIAELLAYNSALSAPNVASVKTYLASKWGLTVA